MVTILDEGVMDSARLLLGVTAEQVPNSVLENPLIGGAAEASIRAYVEPPTFEDRPPAEQAMMENAVAYQTAANYLATQRGSMSYTSEQFSQQYRYTRESVNTDGWIAELTRKAYEAIAGLIVPPPAPVTTGFFMLASGRRGE